MAKLMVFDPKLIHNIYSIQTKITQKGCFFAFTKIKRYVIVRYPFQKQL